MMGRTHMAFGLLAGILFFKYFQQPWYTFIPLATISALFPDIDHQNSKINRMIPITRWVPMLFKHRGFFHSIFPPILIYLIFNHYNLNWIGIPIATGYIAHLLSDCLTKMGCNLLHPISNFRISGFIQTDGTMEYMTLGAIWLTNAVLIIKQVF